MRFVIYGAGAIGGVVGGRLHESGHEVALIARGSHGDAIRREGLRLESGEACATLRIPVYAHPSDIDFRPDDVVLFCMKSQHSRDAVETLAGLVPPTQPVVCLQNGVDNERLLLRYFSRVYAVCVICPASYLEDGRVRANSTPLTGMLDIGLYPQGADELAQELSACFVGSTFESIVRPDIMRWKYCKLLLNLGNAVEALAGPEGRDSQLVAAAREEGERVLNAAGIEFASLQEDKDRRGNGLELDKHRSGSSTWQSLQRGAGSIECDYLNGEIVLLARLARVEAPINERLRQLANAASLSGRPPGAMKLTDIYDL